MATVSSPRVECVFKIRGKGLSRLCLLWPWEKLGGLAGVFRVIVDLFFCGLGSAAAAHQLADES